MSEVQVGAKNGRPEFYQVSADLWEHVRALVKKSRTVGAYERVKAREDGNSISAAVAYALDGETHPVRAWSEHCTFDKMR